MYSGVGEAVGAGCLEPNYQPERAYISYFIYADLPAADTDVIQRRGNNAPAPVPAAAPMDRKGR